MGEKHLESKNQHCYANQAQRDAKDPFHKTCIESVGQLDSKRSREKGGEAYGKKGGNVDVSQCVGEFVIVPCNKELGESSNQGGNGRGASRSSGRGFWLHPIAEECSKSKNSASNSQKAGKGADGEAKGSKTSIGRSGDGDAAKARYGKIHSDQEGA